MGFLTVIGAPSSAGAFSIGQEEAPAALREHGLVDRLAGAGIAVRDAGDLPVVPWRPDRRSPRAQNVDLVATHAAGVRDRVAQALDDSARVFVLGGDCTTGVGTIAGVVAHAQSPVGVVYFDLHADLNTTASVPDGALDWTGMAHALGLPDTAEELRRIGPSPLLEPRQLVLFAHGAEQATDWEKTQIDRLNISRVPVETVRADPAGAAAGALDLFDPGTRLVVHFDVDVVDFNDAPLSENVGRGIGLSLATALTALASLLRDPRVVAVTITELNPAHARADPEALRALIEGLASAFSQRTRL